jgi:hypothetical protein
MTAIYFLLTIFYLFNYFLMFMVISVSEFLSIMAHYDFLTKYIHFIINLIGIFILCLLFFNLYFFTFKNLFEFFFHSHEHFSFN